MTSPAWLDVAGAVNVRDLGGLQTADGSQLQPGRLVRSDNLQSLTPDDVRYLVDEVGVRTVVDLRTDIEVHKEGPGPMTREPSVRVHHLSLLPDAGAVSDDDVLPWQKRREEHGEDDMPSASDIYLAYLRERPDSVVTALRTIAASPGATIVHCAAGKDRAGVVTAFALAEVGVPRAEIVADYVRSGERIEGLLHRLMSSPTYVGDISQRPEPDAHRPRAETMESTLDVLEREHGGVPGWLRAHGWTDADAAALRAKLLS